MQSVYTLWCIQLSHVWPPVTVTLGVLGEGCETLSICESGNYAKIAAPERKCICVECEAQKDEELHRTMMRLWQRSLPECDHVHQLSHSLTCISKHNYLNQRRLLIQRNPPNMESWIVTAHKGGHKHSAAKSLLTVCSRQNVLWVQGAQKSLFSINNKQQKLLQMMHDSAHISRQQTWKRNMNETENVFWRSDNSHRNYMQNWALNS